MAMNDLKIIELVFDKDKWSISLVFNLWLILSLFIIYFISKLLIKKYIKKNKIHKEIIPVKLKVAIGGAEIEYKITRNYQNIEIAHRIYIELVTRKAALEIEKDKDIIVEIYNSWYALFQITREELKKLSGEMLIDNNTSEQLIELLTDILNKGLRPHLTEYQAKFRKWYNMELEKKIDLSPQEIQSNYQYYNDLMNSMVLVNKILINYSLQLKTIIYG